MGNGLQGGGALIGKPHAHKESSLLQGREERCEVSFYWCKVMVEGMDTQGLETRLGTWSRWCSAVLLRIP